MYVVAGVTGHTGKVVASTLLERGAKVRVLVRSAEKGAQWKAKGADVAVGDIGDAAALTAAFAGAKGVYLLLPPDMGVVDYVGSRRKLIDAQAKAVRDAKVGHVVLLSSVGAQHPDGNGPIKALYTAERAFADTGAGLTAVRASYFLENFAPVLPAAQGGTLPSFLPGAFTLEVVATPDIGRVAAQELLAGPAGRKIVQLGGPRPVTTNEVAATVGKILGREVKVQEAPLAAVVPAFTSMGVGATMAKLYEEMLGAIISGHVAWEPGLPVTRGTIGLEEGLRALLGR